MLPLAEFKIYADNPAYAFTNPLAIEFGFWGFLIWLFYFLTTFYFGAVEPHVRLFEIPWVRHINNAVIIATCAFTGYIFLQYLPTYIDGITPSARYGLVAAVVLCAVLSSTHIAFIKGLSLGSSTLFFLLIGGMWIASGGGLSGLGNSLGLLSDYFTHLPSFVLPLGDYHAFYLFWWFTWSIMIGQFVSRFVGGLTTWQLLIALLVLPSIPIALWFSVLYIFYSQAIPISNTLNAAMVGVGIVFVINSLDSLTRLYSENLGLTVDRLGHARYVAIHWSLLFTLILLYQFTPLKIEWIGLVVIGLYGAIYTLLAQRRDKVAVGFSS